MSKKDEMPSALYRVMYFLAEWGWLLTLTGVVLLLFADACNLHIRISINSEGNE